MHHRSLAQSSTICLRPHRLLRNGVLVSPATVSARVGLSTPHLGVDEGLLDDKKTSSLMSTTEVASAQNDSVAVTTDHRRWASPEPDEIPPWHKPRGSEAHDDFSQKDAAVQS